MNHITPILYVHYGEDWIRGSERCLLDLVRKVDKKEYQPIVWTNNPSLHKKLTFSGVTSVLETFPLLLGWSKPRFNIMAWLRLVRNAQLLIKQYHIQLVHVNSAAPHQWMNVAAKLCRVPLVTHLHTDYPARDRVTHALHLSPHVITASKAISKQLLAEGYSENRLTVVHNGLDINKLTATKALQSKQILGLDPDDKLFATVGSLIHRKGIDRVIQALCYLRLEHANSHLIVIGDGEEKAKLEHSINQLGLTDYVHFVGEQNNVVGWLKGCDAFVSGAREEAFGLAIAEAGLAGIPIIAPMTGGIPEFIQHGETGLLYANHGYMPMLKMMTVIHQQPEYCQTLAKQGQTHIKEALSIRHYIDGIERVYQQMLASPKATPPITDVFKPLATALKHFTNSIRGRYV